MYSWAIKFHGVVWQKIWDNVADFILATAFDLKYNSERNNYQHRSTAANVTAKIKVAPFLQLTAQFDMRV